MIRHALAITWKELQLLLKDKAALAVLFLLPLLLASILGGPSALTQRVGEEGTGEEPALVLQVYFVNEDSGPYGAEVGKALQGIEVLEIDDSRSFAEADAAITEGEKPAAIFIPADFSQKIDGGEPTTVQVISDPTQEEATGIVAGIVEQAVAELDMVAEIRYGIRSVLDQTGALEGAPPELRQAAEAQELGVVWTQVQQMRENPVIAVRSEDLKGVETANAAGPMDWYITGFTVMFAFFIMASAGPSILREKEQGTFRRLLAAPIRHAAIIAGLMLAYSIVVILQVLLMFGVGRLVFHINWGDSPLGLILITLAIALTSSSLGLLIGAVSKSSQQANNLAMMLGFGLAVLGGFPIPWFRLGGVMATLSNFSPHAHGIQAYTFLMVDGYTLMQVLPHILALLGFAAVFFLLAVWQFKFE